MFIKKLNIRLIAVVVLLFGVVSLAIIDRYAYKNTVDPIDTNKLPLIKREEHAYKTLPADPGGLVISNQGKKIYQGFRKAESSQEYEAAKFREYENMEDILHEVGMDQDPDLDEDGEEEVAHIALPASKKPVDATKEHKGSAKQKHKSKGGARKADPPLSKPKKQIFDFLE